MDEAALKQEFMEKYGGGPVQKCIQCGTCSASCPLTAEMDHAPRQLFALILSGEMSEALTSNTPWFCVSCYGCMVRCPRDIPVTDIMYHLKNMALAHGAADRGHRMPLMYDAFARITEMFGRVTESLVMARYGINRPVDAMAQAGLGIDLIKRKRMEFKPQKSADPAKIRRLLKDEEPK